MSSRFKLRQRFCPTCNRVRSMTQREQKKRKLMHPYLECRTCGTHQPDPKRKPFVRLVQRELFSN